MTGQDGQQQAVAEPRRDWPVGQLAEVDAWYGDDNRADGETMRWDGEFWRNLDRPAERWSPIAVVAVRPLRPVPQDAVVLLPCSECRRPRSTDPESEEGTSGMCLRCLHGGQPVADPGTLSDPELSEGERAAFLGSRLPRDGSAVTVDDVRRAVGRLQAWLDDETASPTILGSILVPLLPSLPVHAGLAGSDEAVEAASLAIAHVRSSGLRSAFVSNWTLADAAVKAAEPFIAARVRAEAADVYNLRERGVRVLGEEQCCEQIALREFIAATPECDDSPDCRLCLAERLQHFLDHPSAGDGEQG